MEYVTKSEFRKKVLEKQTGEQVDEINKKLDAIVEKGNRIMATITERVGELFDAVPPEGQAEAEEVLREAGLDPDAVGDRLAQFAKTTLASSPLNWRQRAKAT